MRFILLLLKIILHFRFPRTFLNYKKPCGRNMWEKLPKDSSSECSSRCSSEINHRILEKIIIEQYKP